MLPRTVLFMLVCAGIGYLLGRSRGMGLQGFFLGFAFGPLGWGLILLWPRAWTQGPVPGAAAGRTGNGNARRHRADSARPDRAQHRTPGAGDGCPRCGRPVDGRAGACPHCGNVLVPIRYQVRSGGAGTSG